MAGHRDRWTRLNAISLAALFVGFGVVTLVRSAFQDVRKTDLTVYLRAAWAVRTSEDLYSVTDEHGWHYHYPPLLASLLVPIAQPPAGVDVKPLLPFATVVILWYLVGVACVIASVKLLAGTVGPPAVHREGKYRRWMLYAPLWVLAPALLSSLSRGQVNELVLLLIVGMTVAASTGNRFSAGVWLAGAACIKLFPAYLLIYPIWRRDYRWLAGTALGLLMGLFVIPAAIIGPSKTISLYGDWGRHFLQPALVEGTDSTRSVELLGMTATDNQSIQGVLHNVLNLDRSTRPKAGTIGIKVSHWLIGGLLTWLTLFVAKRSQLKEPFREALTLCGLLVPMLLISPVCHLHYFVLLLPVVMTLIASHLTFGQRVRPALKGALVLVFFTGLLPRIPGLEYSRDIGLASFGALALWAATLIELSGEAVLRIRLPGIDKARRMWGRRKMITIHEAGQHPRMVEQQRRKAS